MPDTAAATRDQRKLTATRRVRPVEARRPGLLQRLVELAADSVGSAAAVLRVLGDEEQLYVATCGTPADVEREAPSVLERAVCRHAVAAGRAFAVADLGEMLDEVATGAGFVACAGLPVVDSAGDTIGVLCALDDSPRSWTGADLERLELVADLVSDEIELDAHRRRERFERIWRAIPETRRF